MKSYMPEQDGDFLSEKLQLFHTKTVEEKVKGFGGCYPNSPKSWSSHLMSFVVDNQSL